MVRHSKIIPGRNKKKYNDKQITHTMPNNFYAPVSGRKEIIMLLPEGRQLYNIRRTGRSCRSLCVTWHFSSLPVCVCVFLLLPWCGLAWLGLLGTAEVGKLRRGRESMQKPRYYLCREKLTRVLGVKLLICRLFILPQCHSPSIIFIRMSWIWLLFWV